MAASQPEPLLPVGDIRLSEEPRLNGDLGVVVRCATKDFSNLFVESPPAGIRSVSILYRSEGPQTVSTPDTTQYKVYLSVKDRDYCQLIFQLGHELCHIFADPRRTNWLVESCCEMAALVLLCRMSEIWVNDPRYANWSSYAPEFQKYAQDRIRQAREAEEPNDEQRKVMVAEILCPLFEGSSESWNALCFLGQAFASPPVDLTDWNPDLADFSFDRWLQAVPEHLKGTVVRIGKTLKDRWHDFDACHTVMPL